MIENKHISDIADKIADSLPLGVKNIRQEMRELFREKLQEQLTKLDLVTREEFDVQRKVLARTREKVDQLEKQIAQLEAKS